MVDKEITRDGWMDQMSKMAAGELEEDGQIRHAKFCALEEGGRVHGVAIDRAFFEDVERKRHLMTIVIDRLRETNAFMYSFYSEVWMKTFSFDRPHTDPNNTREEGVVIVVGDRRGTSAKIFPIIRDSQGKFQRLGQGDDMPDVVGSWIDLLVPPQGLH